VSPARRRRAVSMVQDRLCLSERRACQIAGQHRSTQRHEPTEAQRRRRPENPPARALSRASSLGLSPRPRPPARGGLRAQPKARPADLARGGLRVPKRPRKRQRLGTSTVPAERLHPERPDQVWALDFQFDQTAEVPSHRPGENAQT
jgi:hypothetical protein